MAEDDLDKWLSDILDKLTDDKFLDFVDGFTSKYCEKFEEGEISLECSDIHAQYKRLFESRMEAYLRKEGCTMEKFAELLQERIKEDETYAEFLQALIVVDDFQEFCAMMIRKRAELEEDEEEEDGDKEEDVGGHIIDSGSVPMNEG
mmetsp:Transcript_32567/g.71161  ORF Transcript_32567/g.71161 Transcript_32567/m.71161 type:complete len:147 (-) Transcript_32567:1018-1458(-)|eukprot:CAMPEP_0118928598 /NCGR_PEP_ID=MMETSP1169-20130426/5822_1 /TAXON_ID=36882 /ORGANISM="Pyramimonas obovata, Strain CCMP722" /LENGTH=146 /DNA_ID=CAMNT_0006870625 /DNA_START=172 /DNA_END=612 /DNA_ORIENTATION=-